MRCFFNRLPTSAPASEARAHQAQHELRTNVAMRQSPDFRLLPLLPELLDRLPLREQIMDSFNQQNIFFRDDWRGQNQIQPGRIHRFVCRPQSLKRFRTRRQTTGWEHVMRTPGTVRTAQAMRVSLHAVNPASHPPNEKPRSATDGQPSSSSQPVSARISATFCAIARANSKQFLQWVGADGAQDGRERPMWPH